MHPKSFVSNFWGAVHFPFYCFYSASRRGLEIEVHYQVGTEVLRAELECAR